MREGEESANMGGGGGASPWSAGGKAFPLCFSESERFLCPDRSALKRDRQREFL